LREDLGQLHEKFNEKKYSYEYEQEKVKWIKWATDIKEKRIK
jgi:hypothetical protein